MQIHVVESGDSLFSIANLYRSSVLSITEANELTTSDLVVGQSLVIPIIGEYYFVQPGDSLFSIAEKFNLSIEELAEINQISLNMTLPINLRIYIPPRPKREITSFGYVEPIGDVFSVTLENAVIEAAPLLSYIALFSYRVNRDGSLTPPLLNNVKEIATNNQARLSLVITNLEGATFNSDLAHIILTVTAVQNNLIDQVINTALAEGFQEVHVDFEFIYPDDREAYNEFLLRLKSRTSQEGLLLSTALAPKVSSTQMGLLYEAHDYAFHGEVADFVVIMTYEWGYSAGPPLPVSPINEVRKVLDYAVTQIPPNKILMGQNLYGYDWTLPFIQGESFARAISPQQAIDIARNNGVDILYDELAQAPFFTYFDESGLEHIVWFEDARSIQAKFNLIKEMNLLGIAYWKLGLSFPQNWLLLMDNFNINKFPT